MNKEAIDSLEVINNSPGRLFISSALNLSYKDVKFCKIVTTNSKFNEHQRRYHIQYVLSNCNCWSGYIRGNLIFTLQQKQTNKLSYFLFFCNQDFIYVSVQFPEEWGTAEPGSSGSFITCGKSTVKRQLFYHSVPWFFKEFLLTLHSEL